jgi:hypothetical protein
MKERKKERKRECVYVNVYMLMNEKEKKGQT